MAVQLLPRLSDDPRAPEREASAGQHLPYARQVDEATLQLRDGRLMQVLRLSGLLFETADSEELNYRSVLRDAMFRAIASSRYAIYHHVIRRRVNNALQATYPDPFSQQLNDRWHDRLSGKQLFVNDLFLTIIRRPLQGRVGIADRLLSRLRKANEGNEQALAGELRGLNNTREALMATLSQYQPRLLTAYDQGGVGFSEPLEYLSYLMNGEMRPVAMPVGDIGHHIPSRRISFGRQAIELGPSGDASRSFRAMVSIKDYPARTMPGMFDELYRLPFELTVTQSFAFVERGEALSKMNLALRRMRSAEDEALSLREELGEAKDEVAAGRAGFGEHHTTIALHADSLATLDTQVAETIAILADLGINAVREDIALEPAFWAQFPGNFRYVARRGLVSTTNFAGLASLHNFPVGKSHGNHWGEAVSLLETTAAGPYFFNFHRADLGNFTIIGPSGSGKTVVLNFLLAQARKYDPRIVFFDKDRGAELFIRAIGGRYDRLRPGQPTGLNPLQLPDTAEARAFLVEWVTLLAGKLDEAELELVRDAIDANYEAPLSQRRLSRFVQLLRGGTKPVVADLYARLRPWWGEGERAWLFDNEKDTSDLSERTIGFDMTALLDNPDLRTPSLLYFFHRVEERLDGSPAIIVVDEGWKALDDPVFVRRIKDWEKTIRKRNGIVGFATQSASDALQSQIASAIIEQAATQIFMINPKARAEDYIDGFGLSQHEFDLVRTLPDTSHCFLIRHGKESVVARLDLSGERRMLTILSGRESTVRLFDALVATSSEDPADWLEPLLEQAA
jgi:type IV secretion system protein VirB4